MRKPVIGIDLGGTFMQVGLVRLSERDYRVLARGRRRTLAELGREGVVERILDAIKEVCLAASVRLDRVGAVGIVAPGAIDMPRGVIFEAPNLKWSNVPLRTILRKRLKMPIFLDNDVNGAVWAEAKLGAGRGCDDLLGVWLGTGVGGGLVLDGKLHHGPLFTAGEIGHTVIIPDGKKHSRTVEDFCSRTGMMRMIQRRLARHPRSILHGLVDATVRPRTTTSKNLALAYRRRDELAVDVIDRAAFLLGVAVANWVTMLALNRVVLGGGVTEAIGEPFLKRVRASFDEHVFPERCRECKIVMTNLEADAGLLGAALLAQPSST